MANIKNRANRVERASSGHVYTAVPEDLFNMMMIEIEAAVAEAVATPQNWELATGEKIVVHVELNAARLGSELRDVAAIGFAAEEAKVKSMIEALGGEAAYVGMRHWGAVGQSGQVRERQDTR